MDIEEEMAGRWRPDVKRRNDGKEVPFPRAWRLVDGGGLAGE